MKSVEFTFVISVKTDEKFRKVVEQVSKAIDREFTVQTYGRLTDTKQPKYNLVISIPLNSNSQPEWIVEIICLCYSISYNWTIKCFDEWGLENGVQFNGTVETDIRISGIDWAHFDFG